MTTRRGLMAASLAVAAASGLVRGAAAQTTLRVGSTPTGVPFTFLDTKTNTIQGIMVDLITALGKDAGFAVSIEPMQFSTLIPALTSNKIDIIAAAMFATPARAEIIDFTDTVITYGEGLVVPAADKTDYVTLADLKGKIVGAQVGTAFVAPMQKSGLFPEVKVYDTIPDILRDVNAGRLGAGFADFPIAAYNLQQGGFPGTRLVRTYKPTIPGSVGIGLRKGDPMKAKLDASLAKLKADGTVGKILAKWGLE
jgi:polar amino acid transport system substrate-binding protein